MGREDGNESLNQDANEVDSFDPPAGLPQKPATMPDMPIRSSLKDEAQVPPTMPDMPNRNSAPRDANSEDTVLMPSFDGTPSESRETLEPRADDTQIAFSYEPEETRIVQPITPDVQNQINSEEYANRLAQISNNPDLTDAERTRLLKQVHQAEDNREIK